MSLTSSASFAVADSSIVSATATVTVQPAVGHGTGGRGRLTHPSISVYDYWNTPDEVVNLDGDIIYLPDWLHTKTLAGGADTLWTGQRRDVRVIERWLQGDVGSLLEHLQQLYLFAANPPNPETPSYVTWSPNYATASQYYVAIVGVRAGGSAYTLNTRLKASGYAPQPVELELQILGDVA